VALVREAADVSDAADDLGGQHGTQTRQGRQRGAGCGERVPPLGFVVLDLPVQPSQVGQQVAGYVAAAGVGGRHGPDGLHSGGGLVGGQSGGCACGQQVAQHDVEPLQDAGAFVDQVVVPLGQQPQDRGLVLGVDAPQVVAEQGDLGDVAGIVGVSLAVAAGGQEPGPGRQGEGHIDHDLACGGRLLGEGSVQAAGAFDGEAAFGPLLAQLPWLARRPAQTRIAHSIPEKTDQQRHRRNRGRGGGRPPACDRETYHRRNIVERCFNRLKGFRGIATRYDKTATSCEAAVALASCLLWARTV
jgi:transposase